MRLLIQRTDGVEVWIDSKLFSKTGAGLLVLHGTKSGDKEDSCGYLADKLVNLRIFEDDQGRMNRSALDTESEIMIVSQFTLYADCAKGRRPSFGNALEPVDAERLYSTFIERVAASELVTKTGQFGAKMDIRFNNTGPVSIIIDHDSN